MLFSDILVEQGKYTSSNFILFHAILHPSVDLVVDLLDHNVVQSLEQLNMEDKIFFSRFITKLIVTGQCYYQ